MAIIFKMPESGCTPAVTSRPWRQWHECRGSSTPAKPSAARGIRRPSTATHRRQRWRTIADYAGKVADAPRLELPQPDWIRRFTGSKQTYRHLSCWIGDTIAPSPRPGYSMALFPLTWTLIGPLAARSPPVLHERGVAYVIGPSANSPSQGPVTFFSLDRAGSGAARRAARPRVCTDQRLFTAGVFLGQADGPGATKRQPNRTSAIRRH